MGFLVAWLAVIGMVLLWCAPQLLRHDPVRASTRMVGEVPVYMRAWSQGLEPHYNTTGRRGAVVCEVDICSNAGTYMLEQGGSAVDGILAAAACVGVVNAFHSGFGGGGFALVRSADNVPVMFDYRETAPRAALRDMFAGLPWNASMIGGLAVAVPGELRGYEELHRMYGKLPWHALFEPAITMARDGFLIPSQLYKKMAIVADRGERLRLPNMARMLLTIARNGPDAFYAGPIAERTVATVQKYGGVMTLEDLRRFRVLIRDAHAVDFRGRYRVWTTTAPSSGSVVLSTLKTMEHFAEAPYDVDDVVHTHRLIEATKFAFGERTYYADPGFVHNVSAVEDAAIDEETAEARAAQIRDDRVRKLSKYNPTYHSLPEDHGTSHLSALDAHGLSVSMTTTIKYVAQSYRSGYWGSGLLTEDGIMLNNDMDDFSRPNQSNLFGFAPSPANFIAPGKRPLSSMSPLLVENLDSGAIEVVAGSAGGSRIITANLLMAYTYVTHHGNISMQEVIRRPRWHDQLVPSLTFFEHGDPEVPGFRGFDNHTVHALQKLGHRPYFFAPGVSSAQAIQRWPNGTLQTASEVRQLEARGAAV